MVSRKPRERLNPNLIGYFENDPSKSRSISKDKCGQMKDPKIYVAGHRGMVGSAIVRRLKSLGQTRIIARTRQELDLLNQNAVMNFMQTEKPDQVYLAAAKVGGIHANNTYPAEFIYENLVVQTNAIHAAH
jgi:GDP-L-fucose synthase